LKNIIKQIKNKPALVNSRFGSDLISGFLEYVENTEEYSTKKKSPKKTPVSFKATLLWKIRSFFRD
jgi:hypothetical protein